MKADSLELAKRMQELGWKGETQWYWAQIEDTDYWELCLCKNEELP